MTKLSLLKPEDVSNNPELLQAWDRLLGVVNPLNRLYASVDWFEHLRIAEPETELCIASMIDSGGQIVGICPIAVRRMSLTFDVANRVLARIHFKTADILGSELITGESPDIRRQILEGLFEQYSAVQCAYFDAMPLESPVYGQICGNANTSRSYFSYLPYRDRPWHWIELGENFDAYLGMMKAKTRSTIRKKIRELREHGNGALELERIEATDQIEGFLRAAELVSRRSWQNRIIGERISDSEVCRRAFTDLVERRLLRAYLLKSGGEPCAFLVGYQHGGVYQYVETAYDESIGHLSPGSTLLYMVLEDLFSHKKPEAFNFGVGDGVHKRRFANREAKDTSAYLLRRNLSNQILKASHFLFDSGIRLAKRVLRRKVEK
jgi:CelD/BcsL family acetyltransferase involved in cellulose biosynthesis